MLVTTRSRGSFRILGFDTSLRDYSTTGQIKTKTRLVHYEDDKRVAVPPQFAVFFGALYDRLISVYAVTGNPVPVYLISG